jgi:hypothetical protein
MALITATRLSEGKRCLILKIRVSSILVVFLSVLATKLATRERVLVAVLTIVAAETEMGVRGLLETGIGKGATIKGTGMGAGEEALEALDEALEEGADEALIRALGLRPLGLGPLFNPVVTTVGAMGAGDNLRFCLR